MAKKYDDLSDEIIIPDNVLKEEVILIFNLEIFNLLIKNEYTKSKEKSDDYMRQGQKNIKFE